ncbi:MAG: efflux RND transporter periplasmic adaptor subunit [Eubacteriales bacterium]
MKKFKNKKVVIIAIVVLIIIAIVAVPRLMGNKNAASLVNVPYTTLTKAKLTESVNVTGTIESGHSENVYTTLNYPIKQVLVKVGDQVKAGQVLARLDTANLALDLQQAKYSATAAEGSAKIALDNAKMALDSAKLSFDMGEISQSELTKAQNDYSNAQLNFDNKSSAVTVSKLQDQLNDSAVKAPIDGSVTMVNATVGNMASGILFDIENVNNLKITTGIKEFDVSKVKVGQKVEIKTDSTGDKIINGLVTMISPAADKGTNGQTVASSDVKFAADISIVDRDPNLKIGMNARMNIAIAEKLNIYFVPFDAVTQNKAGDNVVYIAEKQGQSYTVKEIPIKTGMETDLYIEISGTGIADGVFVINNPTSLKPGDSITLKTTTPAVVKK